MVLSGGAPGGVRIVAKRELAAVPLIGTVIQKAGHLTVERADIPEAWRMPSASPGPSRPGVAPLLPRRRPSAAAQAPAVQARRLQGRGPGPVSGDPHRAPRHPRDAPRLRPLPPTGEDHGGHRRSHPPRGRRVARGGAAPRRRPRRDRPAPRRRIGLIVDHIRASASTGEAGREDLEARVLDVDDRTSREPSARRARLEQCAGLGDKVAEPAVDVSIWATASAPSRRSPTSTAGMGPAARRAGAAGLAMLDLTRSRPRNLLFGGRSGRDDMTAAASSMVLALTGLLALSGCASMEQPDPVTSLDQIAGRWQGLMSWPTNFDQPFYLTIAPDGRSSRRGARTRSGAPPP